MKKSERIVAIDILRGMTVAGMILVNNPGSWGHMYAPLRHAAWNGLTPTDLVFPFFLFIMGVSMYISLSKFDFTLSRPALYKIVRRTVLLILIGWVVGFLATFLRRWFHPEEGATLLERLVHAVDYPSHMRILGVFPRLGLTYGLASLLLLTVHRQSMKWVITGVLLLYSVLLLAGDGYVYGPENLLGRVDRALLGKAHMYNDNGIDPEGVLSTLPATMQVLIGALVGGRLMREQGDRRMVVLFVIGTVLALTGYVLGWWLPVNKKVWSPSFVLVTCGLATLLLALLIWITDVWGKVKWAGFFRHFGANALFTYLASTVLTLLFLYVPLRADGKGLAGIAWSGLSGALPSPELASLVYSLIFLGLNWVIAYILFRKRIFIKL